MRNVTIDQGSGFCGGVLLAIRLVEEELEKRGHLYCLGEIVHNEAEVARLSRKGLEVIDHSRFNELVDSVVLIRSHGEPPSTFETARNNRIQLINATCPTVSRLQQKIKKTFLEIDENSGQIVIAGKPGHAEIIGLIGQTSGKCIIISDEIDLPLIDFRKSVHLFSQTTFSVEAFNHLKNEIQKRIQPDKQLIIHDTICRQVSNLVPHLKEFSRQHQIIIFVSGKNSSNGKYLYSTCKEINPETYFVSRPEDLEAAWFTDKSDAGICGATSTPVWLMESVAEVIRMFN